MVRLTGIDIAQPGAVEELSGSSPLLFHHGLGKNVWENKLGSHWDAVLEYIC